MAGQTAPRASCDGAVGHPAVHLDGDPAAITLWFFQQYNPLNPIRDGFIRVCRTTGCSSRTRLSSRRSSTLWSWSWQVLAITIVGGTSAGATDQPMWGQGTCASW